MKHRFIALIVLGFALLSTFAYAGTEQNVAFGAATKTNSAYPGCGAANAVDGNRDVHWSASGWASPQNPLWLAVDLGQVYNLSHVDLYSHEFGGSYYGYGIDYNLYYSTDSAAWDSDTSWTYIASGGLYTVESLDGYADFINFSGKSVRYLKFEVTGGSHWAHLYELEAYVPQCSGVPEPGVSLLLLTSIGALFLLRRLKR